MDCIFCDFISRKKESHDIDSDFPVIPIYENKRTFVFLSIPNKLKEVDLLVIPKEHYSNLEDIPLDLQSELMKTVSTGVKILMKKYGACKVLLNNGENADQYVFHSHFHLIPKDKNRKHCWKDVDVKKHKKISLELKRAFEDKK
ncbi:HIT family protein [Candidatus Pacearchaeota archaeon]|nr:HIT family protein [Candidatus Pacearchaeota archaeon]